MGRIMPQRPNDNKAWSRDDNMELINLYRAARHRRDARDIYKKIHWSWIAKHLKRSSAFSCQQQYNKICNGKIPGVELPEDVSFFIIAALRSHHVIALCSQNPNLGQLQRLFKSRARGRKSSVSGARRPSSLYLTQDIEHANDSESNHDAQHPENIIDAIQCTGRAPRVAPIKSSQNDDFMDIEALRRIQAEAELAMESDGTYHDDTSSESSVEASIAGRDDDDDVEILHPSEAVMQASSTPSKVDNIAPVSTSMGNDNCLFKTPTAKRQGKEAAPAVPKNLFKNAIQPSQTGFTQASVGNRSQDRAYERREMEETNHDLSQMSLTSSRFSQGLFMEQPSVYALPIDAGSKDMRRILLTSKANNAINWSSNNIAPEAPMLQTFQQPLTHMYGPSRPYEPSATLQYPPQYYTDAEKNKWYWDAWLAEAQDNCRIILELRKMDSPNDARRQYEKACLAKTELQQEKIKRLNARAQQSMRSPSVVPAASEASDGARPNKRPQNFDSNESPNKRLSPPRMTRESTMEEGEIRE